ncbi:Hypothetical protein PACV_414 [Pacmanvirus A23]|uniref:Hypothetical protein n=1 Tax=Pacmanvirus A23 TaxID=1932881 RepID=UPI000A091EA3|nr:Hypothetical protein B9W72_gp410 [Pacmanvirus A23]SIP86127.1 Hypothetical protein PACV_414 [Pacmanvirus A23]
MGNSASVNTEIFDQDETDEFQSIGDLPVIIPETVKYVPPEVAIVDYERTMQGVEEINVQNIADNIEQDVNTEFEVENLQNVQNTIITLDLMDFDTKFPCPICSFEGRDRMVSIVTLSDHMGMHKYEISLNKKLKNTQTVNIFNGGIDEDEAIKIAISESNSSTESKPMVKKLIQAPVIIRKGKKLKIQESDHIDLNDINCD